MSYLDEWGLSVEDDEFHPCGDDPWFTETWWSGWMVPERKLLGYVYPVFRPNLGVQAGGVMMFDDTAELEWELPVFDYAWHEPIPPGLQLQDAKLANSLTIKTLEPARHYEITYSGRELQLNLHLEGVIPPMVTHATPPFNRGHIDQICRVTGEMVHNEETIPIDCFTMRDRSWGPRQDGRQPTVGYDYATADVDNAFLVVSMSKATNIWNVTTGFLWRDQEWSRMSEGRRFVERDEDGRPTVITLEAIDELGRKVEARGEVVSRQIGKAYPSMLCFNGLAHWDFDGLTGWGEDQDCWLPRRWRDFRATLS